MAAFLSSSRPFLLSFHDGVDTPAVLAVERAAALGNAALVR
jgi:hypothetical protein